MNQQELNQQRRVSYEEAPKQCKYCEKKIPFEKRIKAKFCNHSCARRYEISKMPEYISRNEIQRYCQQCHKLLDKHYKKKFCSTVCHLEYKFLNISIPAFEEGKANRATSKKCLIYKNGNVCELCSNTGEYNNKLLVLQLDHKDGNSDNENPSNLRLLCPNCHSQTESFCGKRDKYKTDKRNVYRRKWYHNGNPPKEKRLSKNILKKKKIPVARPTKIVWPETNEIHELVLKNGFEKTGRILGVTGAAVKKFLQRRNIILPRYNTQNTLM